LTTWGSYGKSLSSAAPNNDPLDLGFSDTNNFQSYNYRGEKIDTRFQFALTSTPTGTGPQFNDPTTTPLGGGPSSLMQEPWNPLQEPAQPSATTRVGPIPITVMLEDGSVITMMSSVDPEVLRRMGGRILGGEISRLPGTQFEGVDGMLNLLDSLPPERKMRLMEELSQWSPEEQGLIFDLAQTALDIGGIVEPTPICDISSGLMSASKGRWTEAGISVVAMVPWLGDLAKAGKIPKLVALVEKALAVAAKNAKFAERIAPLLKVLSQSSKIVFQSSFFTQVAKDLLIPLKSKIDDFLERVVPVNGPAAFSDEAATIMQNAARSRGLNPNSGILNMARKLDIEAIDRIVEQVGLTKAQRRLLHDEITKQGYSLEEIREIVEQIKKLYPNK
jgi:hypothetical protein